MTPDERIPPDAAPADASGRVPDAAEERLADHLTQLMGAVARERIDPDDAAQARHFDWLAREARAAQGPAERARVERDATAFARSMLQEAHDTPAATTSNDAAASDGDVLRVAAAPRSIAPRITAHGREAVHEAARGGYAPRFALGVAAGTGRELWDEPADAWLAIPPEVAPGQHVALTVRGDSMTPLLHDGDTLLVRVGSELAIGDVVVARRPDDGYVVKRVAHVTCDGVVLGSDNPAYADLVIPRDPALVVGVVVLRWCTHEVARR